MKQYTMAEVRKNLSDLVGRVAYGGERIAISRREKPLAVLVPLEDAEILDRLEEKADLQAIRRALNEAGPDIDWKDLKKELGL